MQRNPVTAVIMRMLKDLSDGNGDRVYKNPKDIFDEMDEQGSFVKLSTKSKTQKKTNCCQIGEMFWNGANRATVYEILLRAMSCTTMSEHTRHTLAMLLTDTIGVKNPGIYTSDGDEVEPVPMVWENEMTASKAYMEECEEEDEVITIDNAADFKPHENILSPKEIYSFLDKHIYSQEEAKKAASMLLWEHMKGIKSNMVFVGPTASGKTEIFRQMKKLYPDIYIVDASVITEDGWKGNFKLTDIFKNIGSVKKAERSIIVMDEADKFFEPETNSGGENVSYSRQNELLKVIEGEELHIGDSVIDT
ncbi:MAG: AAA family ATPase, partial [Candidatus Weimeria sp.]